MPEIKIDRRAATILIAANNSLNKNMADFACGPANVYATCLLALLSLPATGGSLVFLDGDYPSTDGGAVSLTRAIDNVTIIGQGKATRFTNDASTPIFSAGTQAGWLMRDFATDAGGVDTLSATLSGVFNVWKNGVLISPGVSNSAGIILSSLNFNPLLLPDHGWIGEDINYLQMGENFTFGMVVYMKSDGKCWKSLATASTTMPAVGVCLAAGNANAYCLILCKGFIRDDSLYTFTVGKLLYPSETVAGTIEETAPAVATEQVQVFGICFPSTHIIKVNPSYELVGI